MDLELNNLQGLMCQPTNDLINLYESILIERYIFVNFSLVIIYLLQLTKTNKPKDFTQPNVAFNWFSPDSNVISDRTLQIIVSLFLKNVLVSQS